MIVAITGNPNQGLGKVFADHFLQKGYEVVFIRSFDSDIEVADIIRNCDIFINNAYGKQEKYLIDFKDIVPKMIIVGSTASIFPDPTLSEYSLNKINLQQVFYNYCTEQTDTNQLLLSISGTAYRNSDTLMKCIDFWLENPLVNEMKFSMEPK